MSDDEKAEELVQRLIDMGVLKPLGYDDNVGDELFIVTDKAEEVMPEISKMREKETNSAVFDLWQIGMLDVVFDENGEPLVSLNKNSTDPEKIEAIEDQALKNNMYMFIAIFSEYFDQNNNR